MSFLRNLLLASAVTVAAAAPAIAAAPYQHVLLISVDGMHSIDLTNWIVANPRSNFAKLAAQGLVYPNAYTTAPSDSFPGMLAQVSGATPKTGGLFYDDSYDRTEYPSKSFWLSQGLADKGCHGKPGTEITNFEALDYNLNDYTGGGTLGQVYTQLNPDNMQRHIVKGKCVPVYPHEYVRTNTIFEIAHAAGMHTVWSDKHPAYEDLSGPSGKGLDEMFTPEINAQDTLDSGAKPGDDYTKSYKGVRTYDGLKVQAVINWIDGWNSVRTARAPVPAIFGMNFQAVSVGQKLAHAGGADGAGSTLTGGYLDSNATPGTALTQQFQFVDAALGKFQRELVAQGLDSSTLIIVSAKHGQSPIDPKARQKQDDAPFTKAPGYGAHGFEICDDEGLVWLQPESQAADYAKAEAYLKKNAGTLHIVQLLDRASLTQLYGDPFSNSRVPDFIALTEHGYICTGGSKLAEHGGFSNDDRNVLLLVSAPGIAPQIVEDLSYTTQIAPTILAALGLPVSALQATQPAPNGEGTQVLSGVPFAH